MSACRSAMVRPPLVLHTESHWGRQMGLYLEPGPNCSLFFSCTTATFRSVLNQDKRSIIVQILAFSPRFALFSTLGKARGAPSYAGSICFNQKWYRISLNSLKWVLDILCGFLPLGGMLSKENKTKTQKLLVYLSLLCTLYDGCISILRTPPQSAVK